MPLPAAWLSYLQREHGVADPVGTLKLPLCPDCYREATDIGEIDGADAHEEPDGTGAHADFLDAIDTGRLIDEG